MQAIATHKEGWNTERRSKFDELNGKVDQLEEDIKRAKTIERLDAEGRSFERSPRPAIGDGGAYASETRKNKLNRAWRSYMRDGYGALNAEQRDLLTTSDATGGALIPQDFMPELMNALKFYGPIATKVKQRITDGTGRPLKVSLGNDTANGLVLLGTEGNSTPQETDPAFSSTILNVDTVSGGLVKISFEELADSQFDMDSLIREYFAVRYGRGMETAVTTGKDSKGNVLPNQAAGGLLGVAEVGQTTTSLADGIGWDDLTAAYSALDPAYVNDQSTAWIMNSTTRSYLLGLKDGFGRPYFEPDPASDQPFNRLMGFPIVLNQAMPSMGASAAPILFGDLQRSYLLRTDGQPSVLRLNERYADTLEIGFFLWSRIGGISLNAGTNPLVSIKQAAS